MSREPCCRITRSMQPSIMVAAGQAINSGRFLQAEIAKNSSLQPTKAQTTEEHHRRRLNRSRYLNGREAAALAMSIHKKYLILYRYMVCIVHIQYLPLSHTRGVGVQYKQHAYSTNCSSFDDSDASACPFFDSHSSSFKPLLGNFSIPQAPRHCCCQHPPLSVG